MKAILFFLFAVLFIFPRTNLIAQKVILKSGDIGILKHEQTINLEFSYDSMVVIDPRGEYKTEDDYIQKKVKEHNNAKPGKGKGWLAEWNRNKIVLFEPTFIRYINKRLDKYGVEAGKNKTIALYTIFVKTVLMNTGKPGFSIAYNPATINLEILIFETQNKSEMVARLLIDGIEGEGGATDYSSSSGERIEFAYRKAGYLIGRYLVKKVFK